MIITVMQTIINYKTMVIYKKHNGYEIFTTLNGYLFTRFYSGYNLEQSKKLFKQELKRQKNASNN